MKYFVWVVMGVVAVAVVGGFFIVGSPQEERLRRFDDRRAQDLQMLQAEIINYWQLKRELPRSLDMLKDDIRGFAPAVDPESGASYEYATKSPLVFELCATFNRASNVAMPSAPRQAYPYGGEINWEHKAGKTCFERTIDKDLYPPQKLIPLSNPSE